MDILLAKWGEPAPDDATEGANAAGDSEHLPTLPEHPPTLLEDDDEDELRPRDCLPFDVYDTIELDDTNGLADEQAEGPGEVSQDQVTEAADQVGPGEVSPDQVTEAANQVGPGEVSQDQVIEEEVESPSLFTPEEQAAINNALRYFFPSPEKVKPGPDQPMLDNASTATPSPIASSSPSPPASAASSSSSHPPPKKGLAALAAKRARLQELQNLVKQKGCCCMGL